MHVAASMQRHAPALSQQRHQHPAAPRPLRSPQQPALAAAHRQPARVLTSSSSSSRQLQRRAVRTAAAGSDGGKSSTAAPPAAAAPEQQQQQQAVADEEARIEALEASTRKAKGKAGSARRQIPIKNMTPRREEEFASNRAEWREGALFPEGWEDMSLPDKVAELYLGRRGMIFWATKFAWWGSIGLGGAWVLFRVGGALGLYKLQGDGLTPPMF